MTDPFCLKYIARNFIHLEHLSNPNDPYMRQ